MLDDKVSGEGVVLDEVFFFRVSDFRFALALSFEDCGGRVFILGFCFFFLIFFLRIRLGWAFGYLFRIDVGPFFLGLLCKIQKNLFCKIIRFYYYYFFLGGRGLKAIHLDLAGIRIFFFKDF